jgi:hypothetical protein
MESTFMANDMDTDMDTDIDTDIAALKAQCELAMAEYARRKGVPIFADIEKDLEIMSDGDLAGMARALQDEVSSAATQWAHTDATLEI